ncbi:NYN domain-containing protein [Teichococcus coralli]|uniref:NYN domain-containing protein n=1 Tax=Teichococcus coralli TaxID=2545983 RepID=UPI00136903E7|nr:NYN domain-containing protein [Pseudoroseomonas coralli]
MERRIALFLDFDNIFGALCAQAPEAAEAFVIEPARWLDWLSRRLPADEGSSRLLLRRCYLNPGGSLLLENGERVFFSSFRNSLVRAGFQVTDCPPLTRGGKTSADIVMVMDVLDALQHATRFDSFVILSSDADFTPVLQRLRAHDRRTLLVSIGSTADAYRAAADEVVGPEEFIREGLTLPGTAAERAAGALPARWEEHAPPEDELPDLAAVREAILAQVTAELSRAPAPLHLPALGKRLHEKLGPQVRATAFGGAGSLARLLAAAGDPQMELIPGYGGGWVRDTARHPPARPDEAAELPASQP